MATFVNPKIIGFTAAAVTSYEKALKAQQEADASAAVDTFIPVVTTDDFNIFKPIITTKPTKPEKPTIPGTPTVKKPINWLLWLGIAGEHCW